MTTVMPSSVKIEIDDQSRIPKYKQVVDSVLENIVQGNLAIGSKIPSINEISEACYLSRDTVEKAYNQLKERKIIVSVKGKGYYVAKTDSASRCTILFLINKMSSYKMRIYNSFALSMSTHACIDLHIYHCDQATFLDLIEKNIGYYDYYVIMPHFKDDHQRHVNYTQEIARVLRQIPDDKLVLLDNVLPNTKEDVAAVYQDFGTDIYEALQEGITKLRKYDKLMLVYPSCLVYPYPREIVDGFRKFCIAHSFDFEVLDEIYEDMELSQRDAYITVEEMDLVNLVKQVRDQGLIMGQDIGIISYNDTPLKELLGITVISTDFKTMGETAAYMILKNKRERVKNAFRFIDRHSV